MSTLIETVNDEERGISYNFTYSFEFLRAMENHGLDPQTAWELTRSGKAKSSIIMKIMQCSLVSVNSEEVKYKEAEKHCMLIIERFGLVEAVTLVSYLLTSALIGDVKKQKLSRRAKFQKIMDLMFPDLNSAKYTKAGLLLGAVCLISGLLGGMISTLF